MLLVVEVSDETILADLNYEHTEPTAAGYRLRAEYRSAERIPVPYADVELSVDELIGATE